MDSYYQPTADINDTGKSKLPLGKADTLLSQTVQHWLS